MVNGLVSYLSITLDPLFTMYSDLLRKAIFLFHQTYHFIMLCEALGARLLSYSSYVLQDLNNFLCTISTRIM